MTRFKRPSIVGWAVTPAFLVCSFSVLACTCQAEDTWPPAPLLKAKADDAVGELPPSVTAERISAGRWLCTFRFRPPDGAKRVTLAGTFNGWNRDAHPLVADKQKGDWLARVELSAGVHLYKFVVNGNQWQADSRNPDSVDDGHSGQNSVLRLGRLARLDESSARVGDGQIEALALEHRPERPLYFQRLAGDRALFRLRTLAHDVDRVWIVIADHGKTELVAINGDKRFALWEGIARVPSSSASKLKYTFILSDGSLQGSGPDTFGVPVSAEVVFNTPEWAKHAIWYQIFPDRFRNGQTSNDPSPVLPWTMDWFSKAPWEGKDGETFYQHFVFWRFYGGDIDGLEEKLGYLKDLGVNAIYLNPVFKAWSNHKYDATSYLHIDDHFGTKGDYEAAAAKEDLLDPATWTWTESDKRFLRFLKTAHGMGFKVIIDGVFNHVGRRHAAFQDVQRNGQASPYADWFNVTSWEPFEYSGWGGYGELPEFRKSPVGLASESAKQHIFNVTRRWMDPDGDGDPSDGIDGWRLDVPNEIPAPFWVEWRTLVKSINPDAYITGEIWDRADLWLDGKHFDAVMNYEFSRAAVAWAFDRKHKISPSEFDQRLRDLRLAYPLEATLVLQNLMGSHDTDRAASMAHNPDRAYDHANRLQDNGPNYSNAKPAPDEYARVRLTALLQMTYVGAPMVYYGDEVGMWGADDPTNRKPMLWKDLQPYEKPEENFVMEDHLDWYKRVIALRNAHPALRTGAFRTLLADDQADVWAFLRCNEDEQLIVALNASTEAREVAVPLPLSAPSTWTGVFGTDKQFGKLKGCLMIHVPALGGVVLHTPTPK